MRAHYLQHVPFEGLGSIAAWLDRTGATVSSTKFFEDSSLPLLDDIDLLIVMGGPMSVNDENQYEWLAAEKRFVREAVAAGKAVLGICLGAQIIAAAFGSRVYPNVEKEIGWFPVSRHTGPMEPAETFSFPDAVTVFHWHGETFDLPSGAVLLASTEACPNQAFQAGRRVIGLQFHLEVTPQNVSGLVANCRNELGPSAYVQTEEQILGEPPQTYESVNTLMADVLDYLVGDTSAI